MRRGIRLLVVLVALTLIVAACADDEGETTTTAAGDTTTTSPDDETTTTEDGDADDVLVIGSLLPATGGLAAYGPSMEEAVQLAVDQINAAGGVNGQPITYLTKDSGTDSQISQSAATELIADGMDALVGAAGTDPSLAIVDTIAQAEVVMVSPSNTGA